MIKKILIVPLLLTIVIFSFSHEDVMRKQIIEKHMALPEKEHSLVEEIVDVYNSDLDEINATTKEDEEKKFTVEIKGELNTTKETLITLTTKVKNYNNLDACNFFWSEEGTLLGIGSTLEMSFEKGEHKIFLRALDSNGNEANATVILNAYDYHMITKLHYNAYYGNLEYTEKDIMNHKGRYLLMDDGTFSKYIYAYDDEGRTIESKSEYYDYPTENQTRRFEYDEQGNRVKEMTLNSNDEIIYMIIYEYDEDGVLISTKSGTDENSLSSENYNEYEGSVYYEDTNLNDTNSNDKKEYNDNGKLVYEESYYGSMKIISEYDYNEEGKLTKDVSTMTSESRKSVRTNLYDDKSQLISFERLYSDNDYQCHYKRDYTYNSEGAVLTKIDQLLGGECPYIDEVKKNYAYDNDGKIKSISSTIDGEKGYTTLKVIETYTNILEIE